MKNEKRQLKKVFIVAAIVITSIALKYADACSRALWNDNKQAVVVGRTLDWFMPMPADLYSLPRGIKRDGMTGKNTLTWTAKYGTIVTYSQAVSDGMNEKGLSGHLLWLAESDYGKFDPEKPSLNISLWLQYYLDNFATVKGAVEFTEKTPFQIVPATIDGRKSGVHLAIEDASGDSAVIEYLKGKPTIYHGKEFTVMTNSPPYEEQLKNLKQYQGFGGDKALPGTTEAADRFVRGAYYLKHLTQPKSNRECVAGVLSVMRNISAPFGESDPGRPNISPTRWRTVCDLTNLVYFFESTTSPNIIWVKLKELDFSEGAGIRKLDLVKNPDRVGDCSRQFEPSEPFSVLKPDIE
ncbi:MAG: linear amide C-N hydrolase [Planctomycetota bacterium]|nr:MAG: linear amide C-N hydrolase [Planctomycetota bacterium]